MELQNILLLAAVIALLYFFILGFIYLPLRKLRNEISNAKDKLRKEFQSENLREKIGVKECRLFNDVRLERNWQKYYKVVSSGDSGNNIVDISDNFSPAKLISERINTALVSILPVMFFLLSVVLTVLFVLLFGVDGQRINETTVIFVCGLIILSVLMTVLTKILQFSTYDSLGEFNLVVSEIFQTPCGTGEQISDIRMILGRYHSDQIKLYSKLNKEVSLTVVQKLEPFLETMEKVVRDYLTAISTDQQQAMEHLADYFIKNTSELYDGQLEKITDATIKMTQIQEKTSGSLINISEFFNTSAVAIDKVISNSKEMSDSYEKYLKQMKDMSLGIDANIKLMVQMLEYIDENDKNKDFTIEKLTSFQQELISTSEGAATKMQEFFNDFKESYTNHLLSVKSVSDSLQSSGNILETSYKDFNNSLGDISGFFESLKSGMDDVRNNTNELSSVYKENLEQLQSVNKMLEDNMNSSSNLTEYINNSLKSNNFTIEKLAEFQKDLIDISDRSVKSMDEFFTDFKDHYSSYIIAMKAASTDMQKSGEIVKESYSGFATNLDKEVSEVFANFEENLTEISIRFTRSIKDLQDAIDELPEIIKGMK